MIEFNVRLGDPETQPILLRLQSDLLELIEAALDARLDQAQARWDPRPAIGVVLTADGYPGPVRVGDQVRGLETVDGAPLQVFHGGTRIAADNQVVTAAGRVLTVCALGVDLAAARQCAYQGVDAIHFAGMGCRRDIAHRALQG